MMKPTSRYIFIKIYIIVFICIYIVLRPGAGYCPESSNGLLNIILQHAQTPAQGQCVEIPKQHTQNPKP